MEGPAAPPAAGVAAAAADRAGLISPSSSLLLCFVRAEAAPREWFSPFGAAAVGTGRLAALLAATAPTGTVPGTATAGAAARRLIPAARTRISPSSSLLALLHLFSLSDWMRCAARLLGRAAQKRRTQACSSLLVSEKGSGGDRWVSQFAGLGWAGRGSPHTAGKEGRRRSWPYPPASQDLTQDLPAMKSCTRPPLSSLVTSAAAIGSFRRN